MSRASAPKIGSVAIDTSFLNRSDSDGSSLLIHESSVWLSQSCAFWAVHGASTGTDCDMLSRAITTFAISGRTVGSFGAVPSGSSTPGAIGASLYYVLLP